MIDTFLNLLTSFNHERTWDFCFNLSILRNFFSAPLAKKEKMIILANELVQERDFLYCFNRGVAQPG